MEDRVYLSGPWLTLIQFKCGPIESDQLLLDINFAEDPSLDLNAVIHLQVPDNVSLNLKLSLSLGSHEAKGSAYVAQYIRVRSIH